MHIVVTGGDGFIGRNLRLRLRELNSHQVTSIDRASSDEERRSALATADAVIHLAGVNRPNDASEFETGNFRLTATLCDELLGRRVRLVLASSTQSLLDNPYGVSKRAAEQAVERFADASGAPYHVLRLPNVFGKWCRPNYNSAVATFCHNIARGLPITVNDASAALRLVYVDDVVDAIIRLLGDSVGPSGYEAIAPVYDTTVGEVAAMISRFAESRATHTISRVGTGLARALYATYVSHLPPSTFAYPLTRHGDQRGVFAEVLKTPDCGQFSFFTSHPGVTRGGHYHHTKTEKFLVITGRARFGFRNLLTDETHEIVVSGDESRVVETVPGWVHDITNVGDGEMVVMLWANEVFDPHRPDTIAAPVIA